MSEVTFIQMKDGTQEDYLMLDRLEQEHVKDYLIASCLHWLRYPMDLQGTKLIGSSTHCKQRHVRKMKARASTGLLLLLSMTLGTSLHRSVTRKWRRPY